MLILGYTLILLMGLTLGLLGAGGSILTIPILVYIFKIPISIATKYSLVIVGSAAAVGFIRDRKLISFKKSILFYVPSLIAVVLTRYYLFGYLPNLIWGFHLDNILTALLVFVMLSAAYFLLQTQQVDKLTKKRNQLINFLKISSTGLLVGLMMGLLGVGGGFLIVPALMSLGIAMKQAIPTSLLIIAMNSIIGSLVDPREIALYEYKTLLILILISWIGMYLGTLLNKRIPAQYLKKAFGILLLVISLAITMGEIYFK